MRRREKSTTTPIINTLWKKILIYTLILIGICILARITNAETNWDFWLNKLGQCESRNNDQIKTLDSNNAYSYGRYQYQEITWKRYIKKYNLLPNAETEEYMNFIHDGKVQRELTIKILQEPEGWRNWYWCSNETGLRKWLEVR